MRFGQTASRVLLAAALIASVVVDGCARDEGEQTSEKEATVVTEKSSAVPDRAVTAQRVGDMSVPTGYRVAEGTEPEPYTDTGWAKEIVHEKTNIQMVFIPAGEFQMGSPETEDGRIDSEGPVHRVHITSPFYMGKYEVTQEQWENVMGNNPSHFRHAQLLPVESVSWPECQEFLRKAGDGLRLPTEAQWEYACRAGTTTAYFFGDDPDLLDDYVWYRNTSGRETNTGLRQTNPVGGKLPNQWGLCNMLGNVREFCADWYDLDYYSKSPVEDPRGPSDDAPREPQSARVVRGGAYSDYHPDNTRSIHLRSADRWGVAMDVRDKFIGFRVCLDLR